MSNTIGIRKLNSTYKNANNDAQYVLEQAGYIRRIPGRGQAVFEVRQPLPTPGEYTIFRNKLHTRTIASLVEDAKSDLESLADEMRSWYDNMPESFQSGDKGS